MYCAANQLSIYFSPSSQQSKTKGDVSSIDVSSAHARLLSRLERMKGKEFIYKCKNIRLLKHCLHGDAVTISYLLCQTNAAGHQAGKKGEKVLLEKVDSLQMEVELDKLCETLKEFLKVDR